MENYYKMLGVSYTASNEEIKKAYLNVLKKYHPDIFEGDKEFAEKVTMKYNMAYSTLTKSPTSRLAYDRSIFPQSYTVNYYYDEQGHRIPINKNYENTITESEYDTLPSFSFFNKSKYSEFFRFQKSLTPQAHLERKKRKKEEALAEKKKKLELKQQKLAKKVILPKTLEQQYIKAKQKLNIAIFVISSILFCIFAFIITLNIIHK